MAKEARAEAVARAWDHAQQRRPVPNLHGVLITEPAARAHRDHGLGELWGVRAAEAHGRRVMYARALTASVERDCDGCCSDRTDQRRQHGGTVSRADQTVAYGPIWDWTDDQVWNYTAHHRLPVHPVYAKLRRLGAPDHALRISQILDGSHLEAGRLTWLKRGWPDLYHDLRQVLPRIDEFT